MDSHEVPCRQPRRGVVLLTGTLTALLAFAGGLVDGQQPKGDILRIGTSVSLNAEKSAKKEKSALESLKGFIKEETGLNNEIVELKDWRTLVDKLAKGEVTLGVFEGYEFAWAEAKHPDLKPLALAVNVYRYPTFYVVAQKSSKAKDFAGLKGQILSIANGSQRSLRLFVDHQSQVAGQKAEAFFSKITAPDNVEDALDDVVDGVTQATVVDRAALEAFKRRKPGRFNKLKEIAHSPPFPPPLIAYYGKHLDEGTRATFLKGLLESNRKEKGEQMLTLFRLTGFESPPSDFGKVLAETRKTYPPSAPMTK